MTKKLSDFRMHKKPLSILFIPCSCPCRTHFVDKVCISFSKASRTLQGHEAAINAITLPDDFQASVLS